MIRNTLTELQIQELLKVSSINDRKTIIQKFFNDQVPKHKFVWQNNPTGFGKSKGAIDLIKRIRKVSNELIIVVVPTKPLYENWETNLKGIDNVELYIINTYTMSKKQYECHTLIIDEVDRASGESTYFSTTLDITKRSYTVVLAAELEQNHIKFLEERGLACINYLEDTDVKLLDLAPRSAVYAVPVQLTEREKIDYVNNQNEITKLENFFRDLQLGNKLYYFLPQALTPQGKAFISDWALILQLKMKDKTIAQIEGMIKGKAANFMRFIKIRQNILYNAQNKIYIIDKILHYEGKKAFLFFNSIEALNLYSRPHVVPYHSKLTQKQKQANMLAFFTEGKSIASIKGLIYGFDLETEAKKLGVKNEDVCLAINASYNSSKIVSKQKIGRVSRVDVNNASKIALSYNLFVDDFIYQGELISSQEKLWCIKSMIGQKYTIKKF